MEKKKIIYTVCIVHENERVLLAKKKVRLGAGWWNGFGGHLEEGETLEEAAKRELLEESGLTAQNMIERGVVRLDEIGLDYIAQVHIFETTDFTGEPQETDEMIPKWFEKDEIPYHEMWPADQHWLPLVFSGKDFDCDFLYSPKKEIIRKKIRITKDSSYC